MEFKLQELDPWFGELKTLQNEEIQSSSNYMKNYEKLRIIHGCDNYYNTAEKIQIFDDQRNWLMGQMNKSIEVNAKSKESLLNHGKILPKGPYFKVVHEGSDYRIHRDLAFIHIFIKMGLSHYDFLEKIKYRFVDVLPAWD